VASPARKPTGEARLGGSVHEEAHPCFPYLVQPSFKGIDAGSIYHPLVQLIPSVSTKILVLILIKVITINRFV